MKTMKEIEDAATYYSLMEERFALFSEAFRTQPDDNPYKVSFDNVECRSFRMLCFGREIRVVFNAFGKVEKEYRGKISFVLAVPEGEGKEIYSTFFDVSGGCYDEFSGPPNSWGLADPESARTTVIGIERYPVLRRALAALLHEMEDQMGGDPLFPDLTNQGDSNG